jgi:hypothetical protein
VVLISGVGLLILSLTNRLGRVIDRGRSLVREMPDLSSQDQARLKSQMAILTRRARLLQRSIISASVSVLLAALLVIALFLTAVFGLEDALLIGLLFVAAMGALIVCLVAFLQELNQSLVAFNLDIEKEL